MSILFCWSWIRQKNNEKSCTSEILFKLFGQMQLIVVDCFVWIFFPMSRNVCFRMESMLYFRP